MKSIAARSWTVGLLLVVCTLAGCGVGYPYYTLDGSPESRVVVVHIDDSTTERVPAGSGIGGGITAEMKDQMAQGQTAQITNNSITVTMKQSGPVYLVDKVERSGQEVKYHEPIW